MGAGRDDRFIPGFLTPLCEARKATSTERVTGERASHKTIVDLHTPWQNYLRSIDAYPNAPGECCIVAEVDMPCLHMWFDSVSGAYDCGWESCDKVSDSGCRQLRDRSACITSASHGRRSRGLHSVRPGRLPVGSGT